MSAATDLDALFAPALDAYGDELARHTIADVVIVAHRQYATYERTVGHAYVGACGCGWRSTRAYYDRGTAARSAGLHRSAAEKRASRTYRAEVDRLFTERQVSR